MLHTGLLPRQFRKVKREMAVDTPEQHVETLSLEAVAELKKGSDKIDPLHIYKINSKAMNNEPDHVLKSSSKILKSSLDDGSRCRRQPSTERGCIF